MSYGRPPTRTPYGDQDFIKEDWPAGGPTSVAPPPLNQSPYASQYSRQNVASPYSQTPLPPPPPLANAAPLQQAPGPYGAQSDAAQMLASASFSLTPEDQIFMQSWRKDSFYQRVLPMSVVGIGTYAYYNYTRKLPHKALHYLLISSSAYLVGKWSYKDELKRRLEASPSQTPFMTSLRQLVGVTPLSSSGLGGSEFSGDMSQDFMSSNGFGSANMAPPPTTVNSAYTRRAGPPNGPYGLQPYSQGTLDGSQAYQPPDPFGNSPPPPSDGTPLTTTSYEELRARNRGLIQK